MNTVIQVLVQFAMCDAMIDMGAVHGTCSIGPPDLGLRSIPLHGSHIQQEGL